MSEAPTATVCIYLDYSVTDGEDVNGQLLHLIHRQRPCFQYWF